MKIHKMRVHAIACNLQTMHVTVVEKIRFRESACALKIHEGSGKVQLFKIVLILQVLQQSNLNSSSATGLGFLDLSSTVMNQQYHNLPQQQQHPLELGGTDSQQQQQQHHHLQQTHHQMPMGITAVKQQLHHENGSHNENSGENGVPPTCTSNSHSGGGDGIVNKRSVSPVDTKSNNGGEIGFHNNNTNSHPHNIHSTSLDGVSETGRPLCHQYLSHPPPILESNLAVLITLSR